MRARRICTALGAVLAIAVAAPAPALAAAPVDDGGAVLRNAAITFITTTEDKDADSRVTITLRDSLGRTAARLGDTFAHFDDDSENGPYELADKILSTRDQIQQGSLLLRFDPSGDDTWQFAFEMTMTFSDGSRLVSSATNLELNDDHRQQSFGING